VDRIRSAVAASVFKEEGVRAFSPCEAARRNTNPLDTAAYSVADTSTKSAPRHTRTVVEGTRVIPLEIMRVSAFATILA
jgi:hypothetical protein